MYYLLPSIPNAFHIPIENMHFHEIQEEEEQYLLHFGLV
jgi:hypothetical protein